MWNGDHHHHLLQVVEEEDDGGGDVADHWKFFAHKKVMIQNIMGSLSCLSLLPFFAGKEENTESSNCL